MPQIYLARFRQKPLGIASAHWAIFLPQSVDSNGIPIHGTLFHARKHLNDVEGDQKCIFRGRAEFEPQANFHLFTSPRLLDQFCLNGSDVTAEQLTDACQRVSLDREFNLITRNCQEWVKDVIDHLVAQKVISENVYKEMRDRNYKTVMEVCRHSNSSFCLQCR